MIEKNEKFPNAIEAVFLTGVLVLFEILLDRLLRVQLGGIGLNPLDTEGMVTLIANGVLFTGLMHYKGMHYGELFHSSVATTRDWQLVLAALLMTLPALAGVMIVLVNFVKFLIPLSASQVKVFEEMGSGTFGAIMLACVVAPVLEEMLFRGVILRSFLQQYAKWPAIMTSAVIFGLAHMNIYQFFVGLVLGTFLGWLFQRTKSLVPCIALHVGYNSTLTLIQERGVYIGNDITETVSMVVLLSIFAVWGLRLLHTFLPDD